MIPRDWRIFAWQKPLTEKNYEDIRILLRDDYIRVPDSGECVEPALFYYV